MGRPLRIVIPGMAYHIMSRGNERKNIFREDVDRKKFLRLLADASKIHNFRLYAYTLMSNHYHLLIKIEEPNLSRVVQYINTRYGIYFNLRYKRCGHLVQSRFKSVIVEHGPELLNCMRYIHLNPLRAGIVDELDQYDWSSHLQYRAQDNKGPAEPQHLLKLFAEKKREAVTLYEKYMAEGAIKDKDGGTMDYFGRHAIGSPDFVRDIKLMFMNSNLSKKINNRMELKKVYDKGKILISVSEYFKIKTEELMKKGVWGSKKPITYYLLSIDGGLKNTEIAQLFGGLHPSMIGRKINETASLLSKNSTLKRQVQHIRGKYID